MRPLALATLLAAVVTGLSTGVAASASQPNREQVHLNSADQMAARGAILRRGDLGSGWTGGARKPKPPSSVSCPGYEPKQSDLVLTGAAEAVFRHTGLVVQSDAQVLKTRAMVALDWQRSVADRRALACVRHVLAKQLPSNEQLVSFGPLAFPRLAKYTVAERGLVRVSVQGRSVLVLIDVVSVARSRTELTLIVEAPAATAQGAVSAAELRLARTLVARIRA
jgi:hypothetical protein